jgi:hypothetical protein
MLTSQPFEVLVEMWFTVRSVSNVMTLIAVLLEEVGIINLSIRMLFVVASNTI